MIARSARAPAALIAVICGLGVILWMTFSPIWPDALARWRSPFHNFLVVVFGTVTILGVGLVVTALTPGRHPD